MKKGRGAILLLFWQRRVKGKKVVPLAMKKRSIRMGWGERGGRRKNASPADRKGKKDLDLPDLVKVLWMTQREKRKRNDNNTNKGGGGGKGFHKG